jgi:putative membrane protein
MILLTFLVALAFEDFWSVRQCLLLGLCGALGFLAEVAGVQRGWFFGHYTYGTVLGFKLWDVPLLLIINWMWVLYGSQNLLLIFHLPRYTLPWLTAGTLVLYDIFLERFALRYDLWRWAGDRIPLQNYTGWAFISLLLAALWQPSQTNPMAARLFIIQFFFFAVLVVLNLLQS